MRFSLITAVLNSEGTLEMALSSIYTQTLSSYEHLIIDGASTDNSIEIINSLKTPKTILISEPDHGLYNAFNKGLSMATGDVVGFLHGDDFFADKFVLEKIRNLFTNTNADCVYGDLQYVSQNPPYKAIRHWKSGEFSQKKLSHGWMPPHPTLFVKKEIYNKIGGFNERYKISADYDFMLRLLSLPDIKVAYLPEVITKMRVGGKSNSFKNLFRKSAEDLIALKHNKVGGIRTLILKNVSKVPQFFLKK